MKTLNILSTSNCRSCEILRSKLQSLGIPFDIWHDGKDPAFGFKVMEVMQLLHDPEWQPSGFPTTIHISNNDKLHIWHGFSEKILKEIMEVMR